MIALIKSKDELISSRPGGIISIKTFCNVIDLRKSMEGAILTLTFATDMLEPLRQSRAVVTDPSPILGNCLHISTQESYLVSVSDSKSKFLIFLSQYSHSICNNDG